MFPGPTVCAGLRESQRCGRGPRTERRPNPLPLRRFGQPAAHHIIIEQLSGRQYVSDQRRCGTREVGGRRRPGMVRILIVSSAPA